MLFAVLKRFSSIVALQKNLHSSRNVCAALPHSNLARVCMCVQGGAGGVCIQPTGA